MPEADPLTRPLSPSRFKDFEQCPKLFFFKFIHGCATPPSVATIKGNLFHSVMEQFFRLGPEERTHEVARSLVRPAWEVATHPMVSRDDVPEGTPEAILREATGYFGEELELSESKLDRAEREAEDWLTLVDVLESRGASAVAERIMSETEAIVDTYFTSGIEDPEKLRTYEPHDVELYLRVELDGVNLHGFIDRLDHFVRADGTERWIITDYKTGRAPNPRFEEEKFFQLLVYALMLEHKEGIMTDELRLLYVNEPNKKSGDRRQPVTKSALDRAETKLTNAAMQIRRYGEDEHWPATESKLCGWCAFQQWCPAKGGDESQVPAHWLDAPDEMVG